MERRVAVLGALLVGFLLCPSTARADCHEGKRPRPCRMAVDKYTAAWGNVTAMKDVFAANAEATYDGQPYPDARVGIEADQKQFANTTYVPVIVESNHVVTGQDPITHKPILAMNLGTITWTGTITCTGKPCTSTKKSEVVKAVVTKVGDTWKILSLRTTREPIQEPNKQ